MKKVTIKSTLIDSGIVFGMCVYGYYFGELYLLILKTIN